MEELSNENMHFEHVGDVFALDVTQDIDEPLEVSVRRTDPEEVDLLARHPRVSVGRGPEHQVVEDGGVGRDADAGPDHHRNLELVPILWHL